MDYVCTKMAGGSRDEKCLGEGLFFSTVNYQPSGSSISSLYIIIIQYL